MVSRHLIHALMLAAIVWAAMLAASMPAATQSCTADSQCNPGAVSNNTCLGDTLVMRSRSCQGGRCVEQERGRMSCGPGARCDALAGRCVTSGSSTIPGRGATTPGRGIGASGCLPSCTCRGNTLIIATGTRGPGGRCFQSVQQCRRGCSCSPEPRCGEDARPRPRAEAVRRAAERQEALRSPAAVSAASAARASRDEAARLPQRTAETFEAAPRRVSTSRRAIKKKRLRRVDRWR